MIPLLDGLPDALVVHGTAYPIVTGFRDWIRFTQLLVAKEIAEAEKLALMLEWFTDTVPEDIPEAIRQLLWFLQCGKLENDTDQTAARQSTDQSAPQQVNNIYDYTEDAALIFASFVDAYGIWLSRADDLHWWEFQALLLHVPSRTRLAKVMGYRAADEKTLSQQEKKLKQLYTLKATKESRPKSLAEANQIMLAKALAAKKRAEEG